MALSKKHFQMIADVVRDNGGENREALALAFASELRSENPRFDRQRFLNACEPKRDDVITVYRYEALNNSASGNPRYKLFCNGETLVTSSDSACVYMIQNGWTVNHVTKESRQARVTRTPAGRILTLEWLDGDN